MNVDVFLAMIMLAVVIERVAELIKGKIAPATLPNWAWFLITSALGITLCVLFSIDMLAAVGFTGGTVAVIVSQVLTGISVGAGSGFIHSMQTGLNASKNGLSLPDSGGDPDDEGIPELTEEQRKAWLYSDWNEDADKDKPIISETPSDYKEADKDE